MAMDTQTGTLGVFAGFTLVSMLHDGQADTLHLEAIIVFGIGLAVLMCAAIYVIWKEKQRNSGERPR